MKEITGSGIFAAHSENGDSETGPGASNPPNKTSVRMYQVSVCILPLSGICIAYYKGKQLLCQK